MLVAYSDFEEHESEKEKRLRAGCIGCGYLSSILSIDLVIIN